MSGGKVHANGDISLAMKEHIFCEWWLSTDPNVSQAEEKSRKTRFGQSIEDFGAFHYTFLNGINRSYADEFVVIGDVEEFS